MQISISNQAYQLINHITILMESTQYLDEIYRIKLDKIKTKMNEFVSNYHAHLALSVREFASYLNHDALSPLTIVLGYAELFRSVHAHMLTLDEINLVNQICDALRILIESVRNEYKLMIAKQNELTSI